MKRLSIAAALATMLVASAAHSEIFKCTSPDGNVSFASIPCDSNFQSAPQRQGPPPILREGEPLDYVHKTNLKATEYLKVSSRAHVTVVETERYKAYQRNRPPPPSVASQCRSPDYNSQCFDPSGGRSSGKDATRRNADR
ncbi:Uncharacterized protein ABJ99_2253 [Pseudomonas syringae pv. cilantro]|uniref:DUF4124 domain-containing protein n=2 Tax=Pseudomonas syringae group TaxID=136849 RepID=A0A0N1JPL7_PSESX|nr:MULTISPECIES: DUF4124 domain-containing protein [Pseudomonas syringae group]KPC33395.1 Uncharacterized protein ABJ99_2253 [Pseudomonas syringae pv. cilantro]KPW80602.1 Uncharacterized protein ALO76_00296 [Pseudomonas syringae pv. coriandricola]RMN09103.1 hypothetical protein ALQ65_01691 [Pseudomonas syringae pv. coriandricola]